MKITQRKGRGRAAAAASSQSADNVCVDMTVSLAGCVQCACLTTQLTWPILARVLCSLLLAFLFLFLFFFVIAVVFPVCLPACRLESLENFANARSLGLSRSFASLLMRLNSGGGGDGKIG